MLLHQTVDSSVSVLCATEQLIGCLPEVKWAKQVLSLANELQEESLSVIVQNLPCVVRSPAFLSLLRVRPPGGAGVGQCRVGVGGQQEEEEEETQTVQQEEVLTPL